MSSTRARAILVTAMAARVIEAMPVWHGGAAGAGESVRRRVMVVVVAGVVVGVAGDARVDDAVGVMVGAEAGVMVGDADVVIAGVCVAC